MTARIVRTVALSRRRAPAFTPLRGDEVIRWRNVSPWAKLIWIELLTLCNFRSGRVRTSWAQLLSHLDWDGSTVATRCTLKQARTAVAHLVAADLVLVHDTDANMAAGRLIFYVKSRKGFRTSAPDEGRGLGQGSTPGKSSGRGQGSRAGGSAVEAAPRYSGGTASKTSLPSPAVDNSAQRGDTFTQRQMKAQLRTVRGGKK